MSTPPITFYPGPSKVYPQVAQYMQDAYEQGILSINHRSNAFMDIARRAIILTKEKLNIPSQYTLLFVSSATESWEIMAQSLTQQQSFHVYNGAFGQKWMEYARKLRPQTDGLMFDLDKVLQPETIQIPDTAEIIAITQNETSNGTQVACSIIEAFRNKYPSQLLAVDATSSLGGIELDFNAADIWYASVQKCLGLPAGLGLLICSPRAIERAKQIGDNTYYNSLLFLYENIEKYQTNYTPNVLNIYLLMRVMENVLPIAEISRRIKKQANVWYSFFENLQQVRPLAVHVSVRSDTVVAVKTEKAVVAQLKEEAKKQQITLGNGYGSWKETTFRIANFPAITDEEIRQGQEFLARQLGSKTTVH